ncbi:MAG: hypothetical protein JEZ02_03665 [Desulfatibacillum sp.]|nr:hypothetical protein [Desulfatibacillum sp.]
MKNMLNAKIKKSSPLFWVLFGLMTILGTAQATPLGIWHTLETEHLVVCYQNPEDLKALGTRIKYDIGSWSLFRQSGSHVHPDQISQKMDSLFIRVQNLLDMKKTYPKITLFLFSNTNQFNAAYAQALNERTPDSAKARYIHQERAIYAVSQDIDEGIMAREMAHAITNQYLVVRPTRKAADILASYVGQHLLDSSAPRVY